MQVDRWLNGWIRFAFLVSFHLAWYSKCILYGEKEGIYIYIAENRLSNQYLCIIKESDDTFQYYYQHHQHFHYHQ